MLAAAGTDFPSVPDAFGVSSPPPSTPTAVPVTVFPSMSLPPVSKSSMPTPSSVPVTSLPLIVAPIVGETNTPNASNPDTVLLRIDAARSEAMIPMSDVMSLPEMVSPP